MRRDGLNFGRLASWTHCDSEWSSKSITACGPPATGAGGRQPAGREEGLCPTAGQAAPAASAAASPGSPR
eukprot:9668574-Heterocapsa_arctica.AAC.1